MQGAAAAEKLAAAQLVQSLQPKSLDPIIHVNPATDLTFYCYFSKTRFNIILLIRPTNQLHSSVDNT